MNRSWLKRAGALGQSWSVFAAAAIFLATLMGCTTHVRNERLTHSDGIQYSELQVHFKDAEPGGRFVFASYGGGQPPERLRELAAKEVPQIRSFAKSAIDTYLKPEMEKRGVKMQPQSAVAARGLLYITPVHFAVDCGRGNVICQTSVLFDVSLINVRNTTIVWNAQINVGAPLGLAQNEAVALSFYNTLIDRLVSAKLIR